MTYTLRDAEKIPEGAKPYHSRTERQREGAHCSVLYTYFELSLVDPLETEEIRIRREFGILSLSLSLFLS